MTFDKGKSLRQSSPYLRDPKKRHKRILDVTERNSVIEGLPKVTAKTHTRLLGMLKSLSETRAG
jgi:hypothetical protein